MRQLPREDGSAGRSQFPTPLRVVVADDHPLWVRALTSLISESAGLEVVATAGTVAETISVCADMRADVLVVDYEMPVGNAPAVLDGLARKGALTRVVVLSSFTDAMIVHSALVQGARGYLTKTATLDDLGTHLATVAEGGTAFCPAARAVLDADMSERLMDAPKVASAALSPREHEVLALAAEGLTDAAIARRLGLSRHTVRTHLRRLFAKLGAANRAEAVALAFPILSGAPPGSSQRTRPRTLASTTTSDDIVEPLSGSARRRGGPSTP